MTAAPKTPAPDMQDKVRDEVQKLADSLRRANRGRFSRLPQDCKRELWAAIKSKGGV